MLTAVLWGAVTTDTFLFDLPNFYPKSNYNVNTKSKFKRPLSHKGSQHMGTAVRVEAPCCHFTQAHIHTCGKATRRF